MTAKGQKGEAKNAVADRVRWVFGDVAETILKQEEERLGSVMEKMDSEEMEKLASDLKELSLKMAGPELAERVYREVMEAFPKKKQGRQ